LEVDQCLAFISKDRENFCMHFSDENIQTQLGVNPKTVVLSGALVRYVAGCMKRERERLAEIIERETDPAKIATAIRDTSEDSAIFKFRGPPR
jgi:hypothetical protein